ncbi:MAG: ABC transporter substrate-binding protein [Pseudomonadota bacterium]
MRKLLQVLLTGVLCVWMAGAVQAANVVAPDAVVKDTAQKIMTKLRAEREAINKDSRRLYELVDEIVLPHFDFERMSQWVLGKHWRGATPQQQKEFIRQFRTLLVRTYSKALMDNVDQEVRYLPLRSEPGATDVTVKTEIPQQSGFPIPIDYSMYLKNDAWKVYDVNIDGISLVANYRTSFANEIRKSGLDVLIKSLAERNAQSTG